MADVNPDGTLNVDVLPTLDEFIASRSGKSQNPISRAYSAVAKPLTGLVSSALAIDPRLQAAQAAGSWLTQGAIPSPASPPDINQYARSQFTGGSPLPQGMGPAQFAAETLVPQTPMEVGILAGTLGAGRVVSAMPKTLTGVKAAATRVAGATIGGEIGGDISGRGTGTGAAHGAVVSAAGEAIGTVVNRLLKFGSNRVVRMLQEADAKSAGDVLESLPMLQRIETRLAYPPAPDLAKQVGTARLALPPRTQPDVLPSSPAGFAARPLTQPESTARTLEAAQAGMTGRPFTDVGEQIVTPQIAPPPTQMRQGFPITVPKESPIPEGAPSLSVWSGEPLFPNVKTPEAWRELVKSGRGLDILRNEQGEVLSALEARTGNALFRSPLADLSNSDSIDYVRLAQVKKELALLYDAAFKGKQADPLMATVQGRDAKALYYKGRDYLRGELARFGPEVTALYDASLEQFRVGKTLLDSFKVAFKRGAPDRIVFDSDALRQLFSDKQRMLTDKLTEPVYQQMMGALSRGVGPGFFSETVPGTGMSPTILYRGNQSVPLSVGYRILEHLQGPKLVGSPLDLSQATRTAITAGTGRIGLPLASQSGLPLTIVQP